MTTVAYSVLYHDARDETVTEC